MRAYLAETLKKVDPTTDDPDMSPHAVSVWTKLNHPDVGDPVITHLKLSLIAPYYTGDEWWVNFDYPVYKCQCGCEELYVKDMFYQFSGQSVSDVVMALQNVLRSKWIQHAKTLQREQLTIERQYYYVPWISERPA